MRKNPLIRVVHEGMVYTLLCRDYISENEKYVWMGSELDKFEFRTAKTFIDATDGVYKIVSEIPVMIFCKPNMRVLAVKDGKEIDAIISKVNSDGTWEIENTADLKLLTCN